MPPFQTIAPKTGEPIAIIATSLGEIKFKLFPQDAPKTVENFTTHAAKGYYDGITFHRIIQDFMAQGGDPSGTGAGGSSIWGKDFQDEFSPRLKNIRGALSMANAGPNTNSSQFFIVHKDALYLDGRHTVFGQIYEGLDILDKLCSVPVDHNDRPKKPLTMKIRAGKFGDAGL